MSPTSIGPVQEPESRQSQHPRVPQRWLGGSLMGDKLLAASCENAEATQSHGLAPYPMCYQGLRALLAYPFHCLGGAGVKQPPRPDAGLWRIRTAAMAL